MLLKSARRSIGQSRVAIIANIDAIALPRELRQGFELMVRQVAAEVVDIIDTADHASGTSPSPFYKQANA